MSLVRKSIAIALLTLALRSPAACSNTNWSSSVMEVLQIGLCTTLTCSFTFTESKTGATLSGTFLRPPSGFLVMTVTAKSLGTSTGWAFTGATIFGIQVPGATLVLQPLIVEDLYNPVIFVQKSCPAKNVRANWIFGHWDPSGANDLTSPSQTAAGYLDVSGTSSISMNVRDMYEMSAFGSLGPLSLTPSPVACSNGIANINNGPGDRQGTVYFGGSSGLVLYKTAACHSVFGVPQSKIVSLLSFAGNYVGFAYDSKEAPGFGTNGASVHQVTFNINAAGCTAASKCTGAGLTASQVNDTSYMGGGFSIQVNAMDSPRTGMFTGYLFDGANNRGNILCTVYQNLRTTASTPPYYHNLFCVAQWPSRNSEPLNIFLVRRPQAPGSPDTAFTSNGYATLTLNSGDNVGLSAVEQTDGKTVITGYTAANRNLFGTARYKPDGTLDTAFNSTGYVSTSIGTLRDNGQVVLQQSDEKLVVLGMTATRTNPSPRFNYAIVRYTTTGALDATYGSSGIATAALTGYPDVQLSDAALLTNDRLLTVGSCLKDSTGDYGACLLRFNNDGTLDTNFGTSGIAYSNPAPNNNDSRAYRLKVLSTGKILVVGRVAHSSKDFWWGVWKFNADGTLDTTFNAAGNVPGFNEVNPSSGQDTAWAIGTIADGSVIIGGQKSKSNGNNSWIWTIAKFNSNGTFASTWGTSGYVTTSVGSGNNSNDTLNALVIQPNDKIVTAGSTEQSNRLRAAVVRYNSDGSLDTTFDGDGIYRLAISNTDVSIQGATFTNDGRLLFPGQAGTQYFLLRLWP